MSRTVARAGAGGDAPSRRSAFGGKIIRKWNSCGAGAGEAALPKETAMKEKETSGRHDRDRAGGSDEGARSAVRVRKAEADDPNRACRGAQAPPRAAKDRQGGAPAMGNPQE